ncbi:MAG: hypothetical protein DRJ31_07630 [Candidatus Methanomethylicota archaeon]|uniref:PDZ domain-containing protein n=1 Tax=Thermoproteota archaeon TaxID=2056631 RepID=A0A497EMM5_9CREN|nr:MAG: hypothetical protein DRJ31_07630 [Candidatus Verstraetearchaeota archaeon]
MKELFKDLRFLTYIALVTISLILLIPKPRPGLLVTYVPESQPCGLKEGDIINEVNHQPIKSVDEFARLIKQSDFVALKVNGKPKSCKAHELLNITVRELPATSLKFSMDLEGGTRVFLRPKEKNVTRLLMEEIITTLNTRINLYGLKDMNVRKVGSDLIMIEMAGAGGEDIREFLARQGKFEAKIPIQRRDGEKVMIGDTTLEIKIKNSTVYIDDEPYEDGDEFFVEDVRIVVTNVTNESVVLETSVFSGEDIVFVYTSYPDSGLAPRNGGYEFFFKVRISERGAERFAKVTKGLRAVTLGVGHRYLESPLNIYIDERLATSLRISADLAGKIVTEPAITGYRESKWEAVKEMMRMQSILRSGSLPVQLEIEKIDTISPTLGKKFMNSVIFLFIVSSGVVSVLIFIFYHDVKLAVPMILIALSEAVLILGTAANRLFACILLLVSFIVSVIKGDVKGWLAWGVSLFAMLILFTIVVQQWSLDVPAIAGLVAVAGTSVNQMIIIVDEFRRKEGGMKEKEETSMHMVWSGFMLLVAVMSALIFMGVGTLKGLAITTILEEYIGTFVTRPAFMSLIEKKYRY